MKTTGASADQNLPKSPTGILGLNEITPVAGCPRGAFLGHRGTRREAGHQGGVFGGRRVLVSGSPCTGKSSIAFGKRSQKIGAPRPRTGHTGGCALRISK
jgi:DNA helicase TIP49 (TBP-interacting protein)